MNPWLVTLLGMGTVFIGLFCLILITKVMSFAVKRIDAGSKAAVPVPAAPAGAPEPFEAPEGAIADRGAFIAAVSAAIAQCMGEDVSGIRIKSVRRVSSAPGSRGGFTAAISAAIATAMGEDVEGIRIKSIKKI